ncbi:MAG: HK97 family phage prohead protease [Candidatus Nanopelagicales bacterium]
MNPERKTLPAEWKIDRDDQDQPTGKVRALVSVFGNVDHGGDKVIPGAFAESIKGLHDKASNGVLMPFVFSHAWDDLNAFIGLVTDAKETSEGLEVSAQIYMDDPSGLKAHRLMADGAVKEFSFGYQAQEFAYVKTEDHDYEIRELTKVDIFECGPCLKGMNPSTQLLEAASQTARIGQQKNDQDVSGDTGATIETERVVGLLTRIRHTEEPQ